MIVVLAPSQTNVAATGALELSDQVPGPSSGTSTASAELVSCPPSAPLATLSSAAFAIEPSLDAVALFEPAPARSLVVGSVELDATVGAAGPVETVVGTLVGGVATVEVVVVGADDAAVVVVKGAAVDEVPDTGLDEVVVVVTTARGGVSEEALRVNTSTSKSRGLDHRTQWLLFSERNGLIAILAG